MSVFATSLDTALNLAWVSIGAFALVWLAVLEYGRHRQSAGRARSMRLCAVLLVTAALFPAVSSSDDLFSFSLISFQLGKHGGGGSTTPENPSNNRPDKDNGGLQHVRLLETLDHFQICGVNTLAFALTCSTFIFAQFRDLFTCSVVCRPGRASPLA